MEYIVLTLVLLDPDIDPLYVFKKISTKKNALKLIKYSVVDAQLINYFNLGDVYFLINRNIFRHLKLEIALAIPASNE